MLVVDKEYCGSGTQLFFCEVAQVHEGALREQCEISIAEPHIKAASGLVVDTSELM